MILTRLSKNIRNQNGFTVFIEFVSVAPALPRPSGSTACEKPVISVAPIPNPGPEAVVGQAAKISRAQSCAG